MALVEAIGDNARSIDSAITRMELDLLPALFSERETLLKRAVEEARSADGSPELTDALRSAARDTNRFILRLSGRLERTRRLANEIDRRREVVIAYENAR